MNCPVCKTKMDYEDQPVVADGKVYPQAEYNCSECGFDAIWKKGQKLLVLNTPSWDRRPFCEANEHWLFGAHDNGELIWGIEE